MFVSRDDIENMDQRYRIAFINSLSGFKSANLIGTVNSEGKTNLSIISSCVHIGAHPPLIGFVSRPNSVARHTIENILATGHYTINHVNQAIFKQAHQTSARYPQEHSEFEATGLNELWVNDFSAPYVEQAVIKLGIVFRQKYHLDINNTDFMVGEIMQVDLPGQCVAESGAVSVEAAGSLTVSGLDRYHTTELISKLSYAKPGTAVQEIK